MFTALVRKNNVKSKDGNLVLGYASVVVRDNGTCVVREYSACTNNPAKQIESLRKNAREAAKALKCEFKELLNTTI